MRLYVKNSLVSASVDPPPDVCKSPSAFMYKSTFDPVALIAISYCVTRLALFPLAPSFVCGIVATVHAIAFDSTDDADTAIDTADVIFIVLVPV